MVLFAKKLLVAVMAGIMWSVFVTVLDFAGFVLIK